MNSTNARSRIFGQRLLPLCLISTLVLVVANNSFATDYYVATSGNDSNPGNISQPFATLQKGAEVAVAGDTVYVRGGTYKVTTPALTGTNGAGLLFSKSGTSDTNRIRYWAYEGEIPILDFSDMAITFVGCTHGIMVTGSWLHFKGFEITNVPMNAFSNHGVVVSGGSDNIGFPDKNVNMGGVDSAFNSWDLNCGLEV